MLTYEEFIRENRHIISSGNTLAIVCNTKNNTIETNTYNGFSIKTEFLSDSELQEIGKMALTQKIPFRVFYDEKDFLKNLLSTITDFSRLIVYNSAQNGIGPGRKALIPSICKYFGIRYTGSDPYRVCLCRDKYAINAILSKAGFKVPQFYIVQESFPHFALRKSILQNRSMSLPVWGLGIKMYLSERTHLFLI